MHKKHNILKISEFIFYIKKFKKTKTDDFRV